MTRATAARRLASRSSAYAPGERGSRGGDASSLLAARARVRRARVVGGSSSARRWFSWGRLSSSPGGGFGFAFAFVAEVGKSRFRSAAHAGGGARAAEGPSRATLRLALDAFEVRRVERDARRPSRRRARRRASAAPRRGLAPRELVARAAGHDDALRRLLRRHLRAEARARPDEQRLHEVVGEIAQVAQAVDVAREGQQAELRERRRRRLPRHQADADHRAPPRGEGEGRTGGRARRRTTRILFHRPPDDEPRQVSANATKPRRLLLCGEQCTCSTEQIARSFGSAPGTTIRLRRCLPRHPTRSLFPTRAPLPLPTPPPTSSRAHSRLRIPRARRRGAATMHAAGASPPARARRPRGRRRGPPPPPTLPPRSARRATMRPLGRRVGRVRRVGGGGGGGGGIAGGGVLGRRFGRGGERRPERRRPVRFGRGGGREQRGHVRRRPDALRDRGHDPARRRPPTLRSPTRSIGIGIPPRAPPHTTPGSRSTRRSSWGPPTSSRTARRSLTPRGA